MRRVIVIGLQQYLSTPQLLTASVEKLRETWGGIEGERFWQKLRGDDVAARETKTSSISHSHVLAPELRSHDKAQAVLSRNAMRELEVFVPLSVILTQAGGEGGEGWIYLLSFIWVAIFVFFPLFNKDRLRPGDLVGGTWVVRTPKQSLLRDIAEDSAQKTSDYVFTQEQLDAYGVKELQILETVLRTRDDDTMRSVSERICAKIGMAYRWDRSDYDFLSAYYTGLRNRLENSLMMGKRRADKHDV